MNKDIIIIVANRSTGEGVDSSQMDTSTSSVVQNTSNELDASTSRASELDGSTSELEASTSRASELDGSTSELEVPMPVL